MYADNAKCEIIKDMKKYIVKDDGLFICSSNDAIKEIKKGEELRFVSNDLKKAIELFGHLGTIYYENTIILKNEKGDIHLFGYRTSDNLSDFFDIIDEPQFKQGDKVLYTDDLVNWEEGIFLVKHDESYIIESDEMLLYAIEIKPYEEEIKIGDWVHNRNGCIMKCDDVDIFNINNWTKITDEVLINKLNEL